MPHPGGSILTGPEEVCAACGKTAEILHQSDDDEYANYNPKPRFCPDCMIGKKVKVFWPVDNSWYSGTVKHYNATERSHLLEYSDGDTEWVKIAEIQPQPPPPDVFTGAGGMVVGIPPGPGTMPPHHHHHSSQHIMRPSISPVNTDSAGELRNPAVGTLEQQLSGSATAGGPSPDPMMSTKPPLGSPERSWQQQQQPAVAPPPLGGAPPPPSVATTTPYATPYPMAPPAAANAGRGSATTNASSPYPHYSPYGGGGATAAAAPPPHYPYGGGAPPPPSGPYPPPPTTTAPPGTSPQPYPPPSVYPPPTSSAPPPHPGTPTSPYPPQPPPRTTPQHHHHHQQPPPPVVEKTNSRGSDLGINTTTATTLSPAQQQPPPTGLGLASSSIGSTTTTATGGGGVDGTTSAMNDNNSITSNATSSSNNNNNSKRKAGPRVWSKAEDATLLNMVQTMKMPIKWSVVAQSLVERTGKQCRERYVNHLNPRLKVADWNPVEDATIFQLYNSTGSHWAKMSKMIPGRTDNGIKNRFHNLRRQLEREDEHRLRLSKVQDFPQEVRLDRLRDCIPPHMQGKADSLWDIPRGIGVLAAQSVLGGGIARNAGRFGPFKRPTTNNDDNDDPIACARCGFFVPSVHTGREVCSRTGWCISCTRIPPHVSGNLLRECLNLRREDNEDIRKIIESWDEYFSAAGSDASNGQETKEGEEKQQQDDVTVAET